jgi:hypothetical protein
LDSPHAFGRRWDRSRSHQSQALQEEHRALRRATPHKLAAFSLAVLHVDITAGILQAAVPESAVDEHTIVEDQVLVFENLVLISSHGGVRLSPAITPCKLA